MKFKTILTAMLTNLVQQIVAKGMALLVAWGIVEVADASTFTQVIVSAVVMFLIDWVWDVVSTSLWVKRVLVALRMPQGSTIANLDAEESKATINQEVEAEEEREIAQENRGQT